MARRGITLTILTTLNNISTHTVPHTTYST